MRKWITRLAWMAAGIGALYGVSALAGVASGGDLDPPAAPGSTMLGLDELPPSWHQSLSAGGADPCNTLRFECVLGDAAVLDHETGLVWQRTPSVGLGTWQGAQDACRTATTGNRRGWRLPAVAELATLLDPTTISPALPAGHPFGAISGTFWTSTQSSVSPGEAARVGMTAVVGGSISSAPKTSALTGGWCVRARDGGALAARDVEDAAPGWYQTLSATGGCDSPRFRCVLGNDAVLDRETGLVWEKSPASTSVAWEPALDACSITVIGNRKGWRLPMLDELLTLVDPSGGNPKLPAGHPFENIAGDYWTATSENPGSGNASYVQIATGNSGGAARTFVGPRAWCVRGPGNDAQS